MAREVRGNDPYEEDVLDREDFYAILRELRDAGELQQDDAWVGFDPRVDITMEVFLHVMSSALDTLGSRLFHRVLEKQLELARWRLKPAAVPRRPTMSRQITAP